MVDNLELIIPFLKFDSEDDFYHLQIIKRKKEHPELGSNSYVVKTYYISSFDYLENKFPEIKALCEFHNARACINLNRRSFEKMAFHTLKKLSDQIMNKDYRSARKAYESVCGAHSNEPEKKWIVDIDTKEKAVAIRIGTFIHNLEPIGSKDYVVLPTKNGYHLITRPFRLDKFNEVFPEIEIHKDNPTILFVS